MRVIGGMYRGRVLAEFKGDSIRPTADRVKESLFSILTHHLWDARVLDLFAGSGNLGIEALSRGAAHCTFNDLAKSSVAVLNKNLSALKVESERYDVRCGDYLTCLAAQKQPFDLIFLDPPYRFDYGEIAIRKIVERKLLAKNGLIVYERDRAFVGEIEGVERYDERKYGSVYLTFFRLKEE